MRFREPEYLAPMSRIRPKKSLGQHFLTDKTVARRIVTALDPGPDDAVLEIGPGEGVLTELLVERGCTIVAVDIDPESCALLASQFGDAVTVVNEDILNVDLENMPATAHQMQVIGNIPYYITAPILFHLIENRQLLDTVVLMMQREVADRLVAHPRTKEYGILSVALQTVADVSKLFNVAAGSFFPPPNVMSSVVRIEFHDRFDIASIEKIHRRLVRTVFGKRRKTLRNAIADLLPDKDERTTIFATAQIDPVRRAEELSTEEFVRLARVLADARQSDAG
jgi:16S rRNA (adenine1518-N6/adenine1519-N6)-dimethyltransferase